MERTRRGPAELSRTGVVRMGTCDMRVRSVVPHIAPLMPGYSLTSFVLSDMLERMPYRGNTMPHERIEISPNIMDGKPVVRGTRVPVELVLRKLGAGMSPEAILADHPRLTRDDLHAAQAFAADYLADEDIVYG
jgi:uncharacterized protein (DUF433 family)